MRLLQHRQRHAHVGGQCLARLVELHDTTSSVVLAMPMDFIGGGLVQTESERRLALPHLASHIVSTAQFIRKPLAIRIQDQTSDTTQCFSRKKLDLCIRITRLHEACGMHLNPLQINRLAANALSHLDAITCAMLSVCCGQVHEVWPVLGKQRVLSKICSKAS